MTPNKEPVDFSPREMPDSLPILPLFDTVLFPKMVLPLVVMQTDSIRLVDDAMSGDRMIGIVVSTAKEEQTEETSTVDIESQKQRLYTIGTSALILKMAKTEDNRAQLLVQGVNRFEIGDYISESPYLRARVVGIEEEEREDTEIKALMSNITGLFNKVVSLSPGLPDEIASMAKTIKEPGVLADMVASVINAGLEDKQAVLETHDVKARLKKVSRMVNQQLEILELGNKIQTQVKGDMDKKQREYYLRQQLDAIRGELGEKDETNVEIEEYRTKIEEGHLPEAAHKEALRELKRLERMHPSSAEYTVSSTYLDWLTVLPWNASTEDNLDINKARQVLDNDHYGLEKAKQRVIEYLAVRKLKPESKGPILCFAGPPGTGKTSLGRSIANALGREFIRISLGGVRDEAEIRGHRRTYVGALPGRIIQGIRRAESNNPVFMLDEIDKVGSDFRGDPSSALLEVLDPEQNFSFSDHYLDVPFDLTKVMFITTANILDTIPGPLRDRMEVLQLLGYTLDEKVKIAFRYLIPRQREAHGLKARQITFSTGAVRRIISGYTREAGLRNLEREIASVCRGVAAKVAADEVERLSITVANLAEFLGPQQITQEMAARTATPGVATGLAWTQTGGEILFIEATAMPGGKGLTLTGQLGDVMKESATAALSFIRANAGKIGIEEDFYSKTDIHIHIPAGAIPKDGPSAGVTILTALTSLLTGRTIRKTWP
jgi:ATP-dependent Lon protease